MLGIFFCCSFDSIRQERTPPLCKFTSHKMLHFSFEPEHNFPALVFAMLSQFTRNHRILTKTLPRVASIVSSRNYAIIPPSTPAPEAAGFQVFHREAKRKQKDRAAINVEESRVVDYLKDEIAARVADRLLVHFDALLFIFSTGHKLTDIHTPTFSLSFPFCLRHRISSVTSTPL